MDACNANSRNTIHRKSRRCDKVLLIWVRHHDIRAVWYNLYKLIGNFEPLYNFAVEKVKILRQIACRIAKVEPSLNSAMAQLRQVRGVRDGCDLGISRFRGSRIARRIAKKLL